LIKNTQNMSETITLVLYKYIKPNDKLS